MSTDRRKFLKQCAGAVGLTLFGGSDTAQASSSDVSGDQFGVLADTTRCVGCRKCEEACNKINEDLPRQPAEAFDDESVLDRRRRMDAGAYTVVNRYDRPGDPANPVYAKHQCMHCLQPACQSACIVGALVRKPSGAVEYDISKCIGCRYCMVACPFQVPAYEYRDALLPEVRKCTFCLDTRVAKGQQPACVAACPTQVMTFGKRDELLAHAHERIRKRPGRYVDHVYGEHELGGTAWLYLSDVSFSQIDLPRFGYHPIPGYTEPMQHAVFKWFLPPAALYAALGGMMWLTRSKGNAAQSTGAEEVTDERT